MANTSVITISGGRLKTEQGLVYEVGDLIGCGGNADVYKCYDLIDGGEYAAKVLRNLNKKSRSRFKTEVDLLQTFDGPQIIRCFGNGSVCVDIKTKRGRFQDHAPFAILELADCNLQEHLQQRAWKITYEEYIGQFRGLAFALAELHIHSIHRDIKPENILVTQGKWVLADFGLCSFVDEQFKLELTRDSEPLGPRYWMSPEAMNRIVCDIGTITAASDVFQLAAVFWWVVNRSHPSGIVTRDDWKGPEALFELVYGALCHRCQSRPSNGNEFYLGLERAVSSMAA